MTERNVNYSSDEDTFVGNPELSRMLQLRWKERNSPEENSPSEIIFIRPPKEEKLFQEREALIIKYMESFMEQEADPYKTDNIPTTHYIKLRNGQMFSVDVNYSELTQLPSKEKEAEERRVENKDSDEHESIFSTPEAREIYNKRKLEKAELNARINSMTKEEREENDRRCQEVLGKPGEDF